MKRLLIALISFLIPVIANSQTYQDIGRLQTTNVFMPGIPGGATNFIYPGQMKLQGSNILTHLLINGYQVPLIQFTTANGACSIMMQTNAVPTLLITTNVIIPGDLTVLGSVTATTNVLTLTNQVWTTNAITATNASDGFLIVSTNMLAAALLFPTNVQAVAVDLTIPYGDLSVTDTFAFTGVKNKASTNYQTAVVFVNSSLGVATNFTLPANVHAEGSLWMTNKTVCTWFYNPNGWTNVISLPLW